MHSTPTSTLHYTPTLIYILFYTLTTIHTHIRTDGRTPHLKFKLMHTYTTHSTQAYICLHLHIHLYALTSTFVHSHSYSLTCIHLIYLHSHSHPYSHPLTHILTFIHIHSYIHMHTHSQIYLHTFTLMVKSYVYICLCFHHTPNTLTHTFMPLFNVIAYKFTHL